MTGFGEEGLGCDVLDNPDDIADCKRLFGPHSYREWKDVDFSQLHTACIQDAADDGEEYDCTVTLRKGFRRLEGGRWNEMMRESHRFLSALDRDERETFADRHPRLMENINDFAHIAGGLQQFTEDGRKIGVE